MNFSPAAARSRRSWRPLELTSMIDVIFLLLIYFILTSTYQLPESQLSPALQTDTSSAASQDLTPQVIVVGVHEGRPGFLLGSRIIRAKKPLTEALRELPLQQGLIIRASDAVTAKWASDALQAARDAGFSKVTYVPIR